MTIRKSFDCVSKGKNPLPAALRLLAPFGKGGGEGAAERGIYTARRRVQMHIFSFKVLLGTTALLALGFWRCADAAPAQGPSFDCGKVEVGSIEEMVCKDEGLAALDRELAEVYAAAAKKAVNEHPPVLKAEQRGWIKGRNECWKSDDKRRCVEENYRLRIVELQAKYRLVSAGEPVFYACDGNPSNEVVATFFQTDPPTLIAERGDQVSLMYLQPSGSGSKYQGRNESFWEHHGEAMITWGSGSPEMKCARRSNITK